jgi:hypothetical protein
MNFRILHYFLGIKTIKNSRTVPGRIQPVATVQGPTACHVRPTGRPAGAQPGEGSPEQRLDVRGRSGGGAARRCPTVAEALRSWATLMAGSYSTGGEGRR